MKQRIPKTNNAGEKRAPMTLARILKDDSFPFKASYVRKVVPDYQKFIKSYLEIRSKNLHTRIFKPTKAELRIFEKFDSGKITIGQFGEKLGIKCNSTVIARIGKIYAYTKTKK